MSDNLQALQIDRLYHLTVGTYINLLNKLITAQFNIELGKDHRDQKFRIMRELAQELSLNMIWADLTARNEVLIVVDGVKNLTFADEITTIPPIPPIDAIESLLNKQPRLAKSMVELRTLYSLGNTFALAHSADIVLTRQIQLQIAESLLKGRTIEAASEIIAKLGGFTRAYAETVFRNTINQAYTAGTFKEASDPDVADMVAGLEFHAIDDSDVRKNHLAANGVRAAVDDPVWDFISTPIGHNCRCGIRIITFFEAERRGLLVNGRLPLLNIPPSGAHADPGFIVINPNNI